MTAQESPPKILVADDDALILTTLTTGLQNAGYDVIKAVDGKEAVELGLKYQPALALMDINMPVMNGIEAARELAEKAGIATLFLTAYDEKNLVQQAIDEGALGYLVKPVDIRQIIPTLEASLARARELKALLKNREDLSDAMSSNKQINMAVGIYMERFQVNRLEAFEALRSFARRERRKLLEVAEELVAVTDNRNEIINRIHRGTSPTGGKQPAD